MVECRGELSLNGRMQRRVESECKWVLVLPSMPKGEIIGKYVTDSEQAVYTCH
jgi:hypothetical protein